MKIKFDKGDYADYIAFEYPLVAIATANNKLLIHDITTGSLTKLGSFEGRCLGLCLDQKHKYLYMSKSSPSSVAVYESVDQKWQLKAEVRLPESAVSMCKSGDSLWVCGPELGIARIYEDGSQAIKNDGSFRGVVAIPNDKDHILACGDLGIYKVILDQNKRDDIDYDLNWLKTNKTQYPKMRKDGKAKVLESVLFKLVSSKEKDIWLASQIIRIIKEKLLDTLYISDIIEKLDNSTSLASLIDEARQEYARSESSDPSSGCLKNSASGSASSNHRKDSHISEIDYPMHYLDHSYSEAADNDFDWEF